MPKPPFTQAVMDALAAAGWEVYPYPDPWPGMEPYYWIPSQHKDYWQEPGSKGGGLTDNYMPLDRAIAWQLHTDKGILTEELEVS